jgi:hypothetical protein
LSLCSNDKHQNVTARDHEVGELVFFHARILDEMGELKQALTLLEHHIAQRYVVDRPPIKEFKGNVGAPSSFDSTN